MSEGESRDVIGVDIGGTKVAAGVVDGDGRISSQVRTPMAANGSAEAGLAAVTAAVDALLRDHGGLATIGGIGICAPGPLDPNAGLVINPPNLPCWRNYPLVAEMGRIYSAPARLDNDGNAAALAEYLWGAGRGYRNVFYATIGTGIGTGIVLDGRIYHGRTGAAGEGGHVSIDYRGPRCGCGKPGCIEVLASGPAIARRARAKLRENGAASSLLDLAGGNAEAVTSEMVGQAFAGGDPLARQVLEETVDLLALWLGNIIDLLEPDVIIMGGGVSSMLQPLFESIRDHFPACCVNTRCREIPLLPAYYGPDAGVAGGAALCSAEVCKRGEPAPRTPVPLSM